MSEDEGFYDHNDDQWCTVCTGTGSSENGQARDAGGPPCVSCGGSGLKADQRVEVEVVHKAHPDPARPDNPHCVVCGQRIKKVPGGQGPTWVHSDSGAVAAPNPPTKETMMGSQNYNETRDVRDLGRCEHTVVRDGQQGFCDRPIVDPIDRVCDRPSDHADR